jgi:tRNA/tmRNA/rRNA uracil-C5-methylase (TrmA/RlmC/RlmD family)
VSESITTDWRPSCDHLEPIDGNPRQIDGAEPCTVLDPFAGSGTTLLVAKQMGRHGIGIELSPEYVVMAEKRVREEKRMPLFAEV